MVQIARNLVLWVAQYDRENPYTIQGASKIKLKNSNKKRTVIARRVNFLGIYQAKFVNKGES